MRPDIDAGPMDRKWSASNGDPASPEGRAGAGPCADTATDRTAAATPTRMHDGNDDEGRLI